VTFAAIISEKKAGNARWVWPQWAWLSIDTSADLSVSNKHYDRNG